MPRMSAFSSPHFRLPLLAATVIATVATSQISASVDDETSPRAEQLAAGKSVERTLSFEGSESRIELFTMVTGLSSTATALRIEDVGPSAECSSDVTYRFTAGRWRTTTDGPADPVALSDRIALRNATCGVAKGSKLLRFTNVGDVDLTFDWNARASISFEGEDEAPDGAFVRVEIAP